MNINTHHPAHGRARVCRRVASHSTRRHSTRRRRDLLRMCQEDRRCAGLHQEAKVHEGRDEGVVERGGSRREEGPERSHRSPGRDGGDRSAGSVRRRRGQRRKRRDRNDRLRRQHRRKRRDWSERRDRPGRQRRGKGGDRNQRSERIRGQHGRKRARREQAGRPGPRAATGKQVRQGRPAKEELTARLPGTRRLNGFDRVSTLTTGEVARCEQALPAGSYLLSAKARYIGHIDRNVRGTGARTQAVRHLLPEAPFWTVTVDRRLVATASPTVFIGGATCAAAERLLAPAKPPPYRSPAKRC